MTVEASRVVILLIVVKGLKYKLLNIDFFYVLNVWNNLN